jgi:hypothetical protein
MASFVYEYCTRRTESLLNSLHEIQKKKMYATSKGNQDVICTLAIYFQNGLGTWNFRR